MAAPNGDGESRGAAGFAAEEPARVGARAAGFVCLALGAASVAGVIAAELPVATGGRLGALWLALAFAAGSFAAARTFAGERLAQRFAGARPTRGARPGACAARLGLALGVAALLGHAAAVLPPHTTALAAGQGPWDLVPYALAGAALLALFAFDARSTPAELALVAFAVFSAGNGKVFTTANELYFPLLGVLAAIALASLPLSGDARARAGRATRLFTGATAAFCAWVLVCGALGENPGRTDEVFGRMLCGALAGLAAARVLSATGVERVLVATALCGLFGWLAVPVLLELLRFLEPGQLFRGTRLRLFGLHPNLSGSFLAVELVLALALLSLPAPPGRRGLVRPLLALSAAGALPGFLLAKSRTGWIAAAAGLALLFLVRKLPRRAWLALVSAGLALFAAVVLVAPLRAAVLRTDTSSASLSQRLYLWDAAARLVAENPLTGIGVNNYFAHARTGQVPSWFDNTDKNLHPHNILLAVAEGAGLPGLALFLALALGAVAAALRAAAPVERAPASRDAVADERAALAARAILAALAALFAGNMLDLGLAQVSFVPTLFWLLAGCAAALSDSRARADEPAPHSPRVSALARSAPLGALAFALVFCARPFAAELFLREGNRLEEHEDPELALAAWAASQRLAPWETAPLVRASKLAAEGGRAARARALHERSLELAPTHPRLRYRYSVFLAGQNKVDEAIAEARAALAFDPSGPEEALLRLHLCELLARAGERSAAREELARALLAGSNLPERLAPSWSIPVRDAPPLAIAEVASALATDAGQRAPERADYENRRAGDRLARVLARVGRPQEALALLAALERAMGGADPSLRAAESEIRLAAGLVEGAEAVQNLTESEDAVRAKTGFVGETGGATPREVVEHGERARRAAVDPFFDAEGLRRVLENLVGAYLELGQPELAREALEAQLFFSDDEQRLSALAGWAEALAQRGRADEALAAVRRGLADADFAPHSATRARAVFRLAGAALAAIPSGPARERVRALEDALRVREHGASWRQFAILLRLDLAKEDAELLVEARERYRELRARFPAEGIAVGRYLAEVP